MANRYGNSFPVKPAKDVNEFFENYTIVDSLAINTGDSFKTFIYKCKQSGTEVAAKFISDVLYMNDARQEASIYYHLQGGDLRGGHPNIDKFLGWYSRITVGGDSLIIMKLQTTARKSLFEIFYEVLRRRLTEEEVKPMIYELTDAVCFLHERNVVHRDIKIENIYCESETNFTPIKLCDFSSALWSGNRDPTPITSPKGSSVNVDPDQAVLHHNCMQNVRPATPIGYTRKTDVWAIGCVMYELLTSHTLFDDECICGFSGCSAKCPKTGSHKRANWHLCNDCKVKNFRLRSTEDFNVTEKTRRYNLSQDCKSLMLQMLLREPALRYSAIQVRGHRWFERQ